MVVVEQLVQSARAGNTFVVTVRQFASFDHYDDGTEAECEKHRSEQRQSIASRSSLLRAVFRVPLLLLGVRFSSFYFMCRMQRLLARSHDLHTGRDRSRNIIVCEVKSSDNPFQISESNIYFYFH